MYSTYTVLYRYQVYRTGMVASAMPGPYQNANYSPSIIGESQEWGAPLICHLGGWVPRVTLYCSGQGTE